MKPLNKNSITFLGTGTSVGIPMIGCPCEVCHSSDIRDQRMRTSALVRYHDQNILIDMGPDLRTQLLTNHITHIDAIVLTHSHRDHVAGFDDIRALNFLYGTKVPLYSSLVTWESIKKQFYYAFDNKEYTSLPEVQFDEIKEHSISINSSKIEVVEVLHGKMICYGYRFDNMAYITDCSYISEKEKEKLRDLDILVINSLRKTPHHSHFSLQETLDIIAELKPKHAYLIHLSHHMGFHEEVSATLPENVHIAYDGLTLSF